MKNVVLVFLPILPNWNSTIVNKFVNTDYYTANTNILTVAYYRNFLEIGRLLTKIAPAFILVRTGFACLTKAHILVYGNSGLEWAAFACDQ